MDVEMEPSDFKMEDFMDVVYKCKFCPYSCTQSPDMGVHVKEKHLKPPNFNSLPEKATAESSLSTGNFLCPVGGPTQLAIAEGTVLSHQFKSNVAIQESTDVLTFTEAEGQAYLDKSLPRAEPVTESTSATRCNEAATTTDLTELMNVVKDKEVILNQGSPSIDSEQHQAQTTLPFEPERSLPRTQQTTVVVSAYSSSSATSLSSSSSSLSSSSVLPLSSVNDQMMSSTQAMSVMAINMPVINADGNSSQQYIVQAADGNTLAMNGMTETKEFLLCGLCKLAFTSMEDCQSHMQAEHKELMYGLGVSVGVQVGGEKRGRKRKSESQQTNDLVKVKEEPPDLDPDDLEWLPSVPEGNHTTHRDGRTRRKVIPPKALKEDYVLGRRVIKKRRRRNNDTLGYNIVCPMMNCKARFKTKDSMEIHLSSHNLDDAAFTCPECKASHDFWKHLRIHLWKVHRINMDLLACDKCDYKTDTSHKMSIHKEIHADAKPYKCPVCNKGFRQAAQQKNHMAIHRSASTRQESGMWFASKRCDICERVFANSKCLAKHKEAVHARLKPFQCSFCGHTTARKAMMELHVRTHTGEKPFKCDVCAYTTGDHNSMRRHKMRHTGEKQYRCSMCPYTCIQSISLKQHIKNKHPGLSTGIFQCSRCPFRSINQNHFDSHMLEHKKGLIPDITVALKVNEIKPKKFSQKQLAGNSKQRGVGIQNTMESLFRKHPQFHTIIPGDMTSGPTTLETITVGPSAGDLQTDVFNMQVTMLAGGDTQVSAEDMNRLSENPNLLALGISPLQLIYVTLSTISEQTDLSCVEDGRSSLLTIELVGGIQTSVLSSVQENAIIHSITYHIPVVSSTSLTSSTSIKPTAASLSLATSMSNSFAVGMGDKISVVVDSRGVGEVGTGGLNNVSGNKIQSVISVVDGIEILDSSGMDNSGGNDNQQHMVPTSSMPSSVHHSSSPTSTLNDVTSGTLSTTNVNIGKSYQKEDVLENDNGESGLPGTMGSSSFLSSSLPPGFINLVRTGLKTGQQQQDLTLEVIGQEEERSVFLIEDDNDLVMARSGDSNVALQHQNSISVDENEQNCNNENNRSFIVIGGKPVDFESVDSCEVASGSSNNINMTSYFKYSPGPKNMNNVVMAAPADSMPSSSVADNTDIVGGYTTIVNSAQMTDQQSNIAMINPESPATATTDTLQDDRNIVHLIPINFMDQNSGGQELSSKSTS